MKLTFGPNGSMEIDNARIIFRNFSGLGDKYNREGDRNFFLSIPDMEMADAIAKEGYNVKISEPKEEGDTPFIKLKVIVKYRTGKNGKEYGPVAYLDTRGKRTVLDKDSIGILDDIDIEQVDLDIDPYDWDVNGKTGRSAYLKSIRVVQKVDRFTANDEY